MPYQAVLYKTLANELAAQIQQGLYRPGERLPSVRQLAQQRAVSVSTAVSAYQQLEMSGLVITREKSGIYVQVPAERVLAAPVVNRSSQPTQLKMSDTIARIFAQNRHRESVHFDLAVPDAAFQPAAQLKASANRVLRHHFSDSLTLFPSPGDLELRRLIAHRMAGSGCQVEPQEIVITNGCQEALLVSLQSLTSAGDVVAVETPCYYGFLQALESLGITVISIATDSVTGMDMDALADALDRWPIRVVLCSPRYSNPSGACMPDASKEKLLSLAQQHDCYVIEDDIFGELSHAVSDSNKSALPKPLRALDRQGRVIYCSAFSKSLSPGLRLGWVAAGEHRLRVMERQRASTTGTASLPQLQLLDYLKTGHFDKHLAKVRREYAVNVQRALSVIARTFPVGTQATHPQGGFVVWISLPESGIDAMTLLDLAQAQGICFVPGNVFGLLGADLQGQGLQDQGLQGQGLQRQDLSEEGSQGLKYCFRISIAQPWTDRLEAALATLGQLAAQ